MCAKTALAVSCEGERNWSLAEHKYRPMQQNCEAIPDLRRIAPIPICVGDELEAVQEGIDVDVGQLLGLVGFSWRIDRTRIGGVQLEDQIIHVRWCPR